MKTIARHWEEQFDELIRDGRSGQYTQRLDWFLFKLHLAVQTFETQSDGSRLLIFRDGSVYGEESELDVLLALPQGRHSGYRRVQTKCARGRKNQKGCRKGNEYVGPI